MYQNSHQDIQKKPEYVHQPSLPLMSKYRHGTESLHDDTNIKENTRQGVAAKVKTTPTSSPQTPFPPPNTIFIPFRDKRSKTAPWWYPAHP